MHRCLSERLALPSRRRTRVAIFLARKTGQEFVLQPEKQQHAFARKTTKKTATRIRQKNGPEKRRRNDRVALHPRLVKRAHTHTHTHTRTHAHTHAHSRTHTQTHTHARTHAHTYTHTHTHTHRENRYMKNYRVAFDPRLLKRAAHLLLQVLFWVQDSGSRVEG